MTKFQILYFGAVTLPLAFILIAIGGWKEFVATLVGTFIGCGLLVFFIRLGERNK